MMADQVRMPKYAHIIVSISSRLQRAARPATPSLCQIVPDQEEERGPCAPILSCPGAKTSDCVFGSDCLDCGIRASGDDCEDGIVELCRDDVVNCAFTDDGTCDDGGEGGALTHRSSHSPRGRPPQNASHAFDSALPHPTQTLTTTSVHSRATAMTAGRARFTVTCRLRTRSMTTHASMASSRSIMTTPRIFTRFTTRRLRRRWAATGLGRRGAIRPATSCT
jgi:hypothetical protein